MLALTLWQPWGWAIMHLPVEVAKPVENRDWVAERVVGKRIAIHGGLTYDPEVSLDIMDATGWDIDRLRREANGKRAADRGILGTVRIPGIVEEWPYNQRLNGAPRFRLVAGDWGDVSPERCDAWFSGRYGWLMDQRVTLPEPIPCKGAQGLWRVPDEIAARLA